MPPVPDAGCPTPLVLSGGPPRKMATGPEEDLVKPGGGWQGNDDIGVVWGGRQDFFFFNSEKQLPCIFVFYVSSCRSFYFFLMIKILHASQRKNIFRQSRKREERSQYNSTSLRQSP